MVTKFERMYQARLAAGKYICVGLDPDVRQIPECVVGKHDAVRVVHFLGNIIRATSQYAAAYKLQSSYYEGLGKRGPGALRAVVAIIRSIDPTIPIILDYKRGDIGRSNEPYARLAFDTHRVDAVTIHPYLGMEAMEPFLSHTDKTIIVLCRTSNPGAGEFQDVDVHPARSVSSHKLYSTRNEGVREGDEGPFKYDRSMPLYQFVAHRVAQSWNARGNCAVVVGATAPSELKLVREIVGNMLILIPGIGTQGGDLAASIVNGGDGDGGGFILNNSSAILFAYKQAGNPEEYASAAGQAAQQMNTAVRKVLTA
ncbi:orotidine-5'-phosphate decarboxylase [soil metagenome]